MSIRFPELRLSELNYNEILMYLGYRGQEIPPDLDSQIYNCIKTVMKTARPAGVWKVSAVKNGEAADFPMQGNDIKQLLKDCDEAVFMAVTLGPEIDRMLMRTEIRNMSDALIMDACASSAVENVCNHFEEDLREIIEAGGRYLTDRFSPGYGDLPLHTQPLFAEYLDTGRRIGLTVTDNDLMIPRKSVTAVMGISNTRPQMRARGCEVCSMFRNCQIRKNGKHCGKG